MWSPGEFCRNCWVGMLDYPKPGCYSILDYAPKIPIKLISFPPNDTQYTRTKLSYFYTRLQTKLHMLGNHTFHSGLNTGAGHTYITHTWEQVTVIVAEGLNAVRPKCKSLKEIQKVIRAHGVQVQCAEHSLGNN